MTRVGFCPPHFPIRVKGLVSRKSSLSREAGRGAPPFLKEKERDDRGLSARPSPYGPASLGWAQPVLGMTHFLPPAHVRLVKGLVRKRQLECFFVVVVKTGTLLFLGLMWLQLGELITSCQ